MLKQTKKSDYEFLVEMLIEARTRYVKLHFKETNAILANLQEQPAKKVALLIAWLQNMITCETSIFQRLKIQKETYFDQVFESTLFQIIKQKIDAEIKAQPQEFQTSFQLVQVLMLPMDPYFSTKHLNEMRLAALKRFSESSDQFLQKLKSSLLSPQSELNSNIQIESQLGLCATIFKKLLSITSK